MSLSIEENLVEHLRANADVSPLVGDRIHQNNVPEHSALPYVWFRRSGEFEPLTLDGAGGLISTAIDVECIAGDLSTAADLSLAVRRALHGARGSFGAGSVSAVFVDDVSDDYEPRGIGSDDGISFSAMSLTVWHTTQ